MQDRKQEFPGAEEGQGLVFSECSLSVVGDENVLGKKCDVTQQRENI